MIQTIRGLVDAVALAASAEGMDVSPSDVGHILSLFFEGMVCSGSYHDKSINEILQRIADECANVRDE